MVYRKCNIRVLLGPETLQKHVEDVENDAPENGNQTSRTILRKSSEKQPCEKISEINVYKRFRPFQAFVNKPKLERYPTTLRLSGHKVENEVETLQSAKSKVSATTTNIDETHFKTDKFEKMLHKFCINPKVQSASDVHFKYCSKKKAARGQSSASTTCSISPRFFTDYGFQLERTDTFSGHYRRHVASADIERQMEEQAERHIRMCQIVGNVKRSSKAQFSCQGLRDIVSPLTMKTACRQSNKIHNSLVKNNSYVPCDSTPEKSSIVTNVLQIRKTVGSLAKIKSIQKACQANDPLPEISVRTVLVGFGCTV